MYCKSLAVVAALAVGVTAVPTSAASEATHVASSSASLSASPDATPSPKVDVSGFWAMMQVNSDTNRCYIHLNFPGVGCTGDTSDLMLHESNNCYAYVSSGSVSSQLYCGDATGTLWTKGTKQGVFQFVNAEGQSVDVRFKTSTSDDGKTFSIPDNGPGAVWPGN